MLQVGDRVKDFALEAGDGGRVELSALRGRKVVVYFYPRDDTPGCTREACGFRDQHPDFGAAGALVLGISGDGVASHRKFADKYELPFRLLSDPDHRVAEAFGAWGERSLYGRRFMGIIRSTFLLDEEGRVMRVWPKVQVDGHAQEVLAAIRGEAPPASAARKKSAAAKKKTKPAAAKKKTKPAAAKKKKKPAAARKKTTNKKPGAKRR